MRRFAVPLLFHLLPHGPALAEIPTFTAGDAASYIGTTVCLHACSILKIGGLTQQQANDVNVGENDVVVDEINGLTVTFGADFSSRIHDAFNANCADKYSDQCIRRTREAFGLGATSDGLQKRMVSFIEAAAGVVLRFITWAIYMAGAPRTEKIQIKIPQPEKEQVAEWTLDEGKFVFDPSDGDPYEIDMNFDPTPKPDE